MNKERTKLTIRIPKTVLENAKLFANENKTTLTRLISGYLENLARYNEPLKNAPIVRRLSGTLSPDVDIEDYERHLEEKHA